MNHRRITYAKIFCNLLFFALTICIVVSFVPKVLVFFMPFVVAWIIACIATPIVHLVERLLKLRRKTSMVFVVVAIIAAVVSVLYASGIFVIKIVTNFIEDLPDLWQSIRIEAELVFQVFFDMLEKFPGNSTTSLQNIVANSEDYIADVIGNLSVPTISAVGSVASMLPDIIVFIIMCLIATYFFVVERETINAKVYEWMPESILRVWDLIKRCFVTSVGGYFKAQLKIEVWIYVLIFIGLFVLRVRYSFLVAFGIAFLDLLPVFGTGTVLWPWALIKLINGQYMEAAGMMLIWGISQVLRQMIQPKYVGETLGIHPLPTLFLLFTGYKISGVFGMIIAVPLGILVSTLYKEGVFEMAQQSMILLIGRIRTFCQYDQTELEEIEQYKQKENK